jgi:hypothetical protein
MYFAAKNLLYTFHKSLDTQFVTVASFKCYARSPETRTHSKTISATSTPAIVLSLTSENAPKIHCLATSQNTAARKALPLPRGSTPKGGGGVILSQRTSPPRSWKPSKPCKSITPPVQGVMLWGDTPNPAIYRPFGPSTERTESAAYYSPGHRPGKKTPNHPQRPEGAAYSPLNRIWKSLCSLRQNKKNAKQTHFKNHQNRRNSLSTQDSGLRSQVRHSQKQTHSKPFSDQPPP